MLLSRAFIISYFRYPLCSLHETKLMKNLNLLCTHCTGKSDQFM